MSLIRALTIITLMAISSSQAYADNSRMYFEFGYVANTTKPVNTFGARLNLHYDNFTIYGLAGTGYTQITETSSATLYETTKVAPASFQLV